MSEATRHLLICVDDNEASEHALTWLVEQFYRPGDQVHVVYVVLVFGVTHFPDPHKVDALSYLHMHDGKEKQHAEDFMSRRFKPILEKGSVNYTFEVIRNVLEVEGVAPTVLRVARKFKVPAIVVGKCHKGFERLWHGSLSTQLIKQGEVPVIVAY